YQSINEVRLSASRRSEQTKRIGDVGRRIPCKCLGQFSHRRQPRPIFRESHKASEGLVPVHKSYSISPSRKEREGGFCPALSLPYFKGERAFRKGVATGRKLLT